ncbi:MAG: GNAT family N-acetyltransferase [Beijerinckiaceae bacterium]
MQGLTFRVAEAGDVAALVALYADDILGAGRETADAADLKRYRDGLDRVIACPSTNIYMVERDGVVVGTFQLTFTPGVAQQGLLRATVEAVRTRADLRGQGIGAAMMRFVEQAARARGAGLIQLSSNIARPAAHRFYARLGYAHSHAGFKLYLR